MSCHRHVKTREDLTVSRDLRRWMVELNHGESLAVRGSKLWGYVMEGRLSQIYYGQIWL